MFIRPRQGSCRLSRCSTAAFRAIINRHWAYSAGKCSSDAITRLFTSEYSDYCSDGAKLGTRVTCRCGRLKRRAKGRGWNNSGLLEGARRSDERWLWSQGSHSINRKDDANALVEHGSVIEQCRDGGPVNACCSALIDYPKHIQSNTTSLAFCFGWRANFPAENYGELSSGSRYIRSSLNAYISASIR